MHPRFSRRAALQLGLTGAAALGLARPAFGQAPTTLRIHQMLPAQATIPARALAPWAQKVEREAGGRLRAQQFNTMALGGTPPQLFDQARDGVVDIVWTVLGYTPGRFNRCEVFELPFMSSTAEASSKAFQEYADKFAADEFKDVKVICVHTHGPGLFHTRTPILGLESLRGMKVRGGSRIISNMLGKLGAIPVGMPVPAVTDALSKGVIDGTTIPWEVTPSLKVAELVKHHTGFAGREGLYTQTFVVAMHKASYDRLPPESKRVIDANSGIETAAFFGRAMDEGDTVGRELAQRAGNQIVMLDVAETQRWRRTAAAVETDWLAETKGKNIDGARLLAEARTLLGKYQR
jgi:TRAP-type transport system periplasmic protein